MHCYECIQTEVLRTESVLNNLHSWKNLTQQKMMSLFQYVFLDLIFVSVPLLQFNAECAGKGKLVSGVLRMGFSLIGFTHQDSH